MWRIAACLGAGAAFLASLREPINMHYSNPSITWPFLILFRPLPLALAISRAI